MDGFLFHRTNTPAFARGSLFLFPSLLTASVTPQLDRMIHGHTTGTTAAAEIDIAARMTRGTEQSLGKRHEDARVFMPNPCLPVTSLVSRRHRLHHRQSCMTPCLCVPYSANHVPHVIAYMYRDARRVNRRRTGGSPDMEAKSPPSDTACPSKHRDNDLSRLVFCLSLTASCDDDPQTSVLVSHQ